MGIQDGILVSHLCPLVIIGLRRRVALLEIMPYKELIVVHLEIHRYHLRVQVAGEMDMLFA